MRLEDIESIGFAKNVKLEDIKKAGISKNMIYGSLFDIDLLFDSDGITNLHGLINTIIDIIGVKIIGMEKKEAHLINNIFLDTNDTIMICIVTEECSFCNCKFKGNNTKPTIIHTFVHDQEGFICLKVPKNLDFILAKPGSIGKHLHLKDKIEMENNVAKEPLGPTGEMGNIING